MDFKELKVIWDSQTAEPLYAIDQAALHQIVKRRNANFRRCVSRGYRIEIGSSLLFGGMFLVGAVLLFLDPAWLIQRGWVRVQTSGWDIATLLLSAATWFYSAGYMIIARRRQQPGTSSLESTLRGDLELALEQTQFEIKLMKRLLWHGALPVWCAATLGCIAIYRLKGASPQHYLMLTVILVVGLVLTIACNRRWIQKRFEPRLRELEELRDKLNDPQR